jgi:hypothetical protein
MPTLLYFADSPAGGCGATIRLDSGEPCLLSVAQSSVFVRKSRFGIFGPVLYRERVIYNSAKTAQALASLFPDNLLPAGFKNPVLRAFANAIMHCASCAEVTVTLNEAIARAERQDTQDNQIISNFAFLMEKGSLKADAFYDVAVLPHPKEEILQAIERQILREPVEARVEWLKVGVLFLPNFQEGVGPGPLPMTGFDLDLAGRTPQSIREELTKSAADIERADRFLSLMKADSDRMLVRIAAAVNLRDTQQSKRP